MASSTPSASVASHTVVSFFTKKARREPSASLDASPIAAASASLPTAPSSVFRCGGMRGKPQNTNGDGNRPSATRMIGNAVLIDMMPPRSYVVTNSDASALDSCSATASRRAMSMSVPPQRSTTAAATASDPLPKAKSPWQAAGFEAATIATGGGAARVSGSGSGWLFCVVSASGLMASPAAFNASNAPFITAELSDSSLIACTRASPSFFRIADAEALSALLASPGACTARTSLPTASSYSSSCGGMRKMPSKMKGAL